MPQILHIASRAFILALYLTAMLGGEFLHAHPTYGDGKARYASHDCGEKELHQPLTQASSCLICARTTSPQLIIPSTSGFSLFLPVISAAASDDTIVSFDRNELPADRAPPGDLG